MISVSTLLDQVRDAMDDIQHAQSQLGRRELAEDQVAALDGISDDFRALSGLARVCAAIGRQSDDQSVIVD
jgi:hypothetical protein